MKNKTLWFSPGLALVVAFVHGLVYVFLMPPWQHYDEPSHFEHVWLIATNQPRENADLNFRVRLVQSMINHDFYRGAALPVLETIETGALIYGLEYSQLDESPLYYGVAALPVSLLRESNPAVMLIGARMVSVGFLLLTVLSLWGFTREMTASETLRFWVPLSAALLPGFVDLMTAVNNDVGAVMAFTLFLWASMYFLNHPHRLGGALWVLVGMGLCVGMKSTSYFAAPLGVLVFLLGWIKGPLAKWGWAGVLILVLIGISALVTWEEAAYWHRGTSQLIPTRVQTTVAPVGQYALQLDASAPTTPNFIRPLQQPLFPQPINTPLTFGVWMWHSSPTPLEIRTPVLTSGKEVFYETVLVTNTPQFFSFDVSLTVPSNWLWLSLAPTTSNTDLIVYYDGFILVEGQYPHGEVPVFTDVQGQTGTWGGQPFLNMVRNSSVENIWPALSPAIDNQISRFVPNHTRVSMLLFGLYDGAMTARYFRITVQNLLETFWGRFGWGHVPLVLHNLYAVLKLFTWVSLAGGSIAWIRGKISTLPKKFFLFIALGLVWGATLLRGEIFIFTTHLFIPGARYAYPAIGPTLLILLSGWLVLGRFLNKNLPTTPLFFRCVAYIMYGLVFLSLDILSIYSILHYYQRI
ncbi:MAG: hypothetical protein Fur0022_34890 [Anaerolineales bacterium]